MEKLVQKAILGDTDAFLELMEKSSLSMYKVARGILGNDDDAADAIQDTILSCFEKLGESLGFSGDFQKYAKVENINSQTANGMTVTLSEVYCNDAALYVSLVIESEDTFPKTLNFQDSDTPLINLYDSTLKFSYSEREEQLFGVANALDGKMVDEHTYAGVLRYDLSYSNTFMKEETIEIPEQFTVEFHIPQISGLKPDGKLPEMPEDLRAEYEQAMRDNGLGLTDEDYANFTEEQKEIEHRLFTKMNNAYDERYPDTWEQPNQYENWWVDGPWDFTFDVTKDHSQTIVEEINDVDENGLGLVSVTKTPFELTIDDGNGADYFTVVLDADGNILDSGKFGGDTNVLAIGGRDISHIDIYICDYGEYMDEVTCSHHLTSFEVGASYSMPLMGQVSISYPRLPGGSIFSPNTGITTIFRPDMDTNSVWKQTYFLHREQT